MIKLASKALFAAVIAGGIAIAPVAQAGYGSFKTPEAPILIEDESWWSAELSFGYDSTYMFRGVEQFGGSSLVWTDFSLSAYNATIGVWYADGISTSDNEFNAYASYAWGLGPVDIEGGYIYYHFPSSGSSSGDAHEIFVALSTELGFVTPTLSYYQDVKDFDYGYLEFALYSSFPVVEDVVSIDPYVLVSAAFDYEGSDASWNHFQAGIEIPLSLSENVTLTGYGAVSVPLDSSVNNDEEEFWGGAYVTFSF